LPTSSCQPSKAEQVRAQELEELEAAKFREGFQRTGFAAMPPANELDRPSRARLTYTTPGDRSPSLTIDFTDSGVLTVRPRGHSPITRRRASWRSPPRVEAPFRVDKPGDNGASCLWRAVYPYAYFDLQRRVAVVSIGFQYDELCSVWRLPADDVVVVTW
jgi:hypothetical protein